MKDSCHFPEPFLSDLFILSVTQELAEEICSSCGVEAIPRSVKAYLILKVTENNYKESVEELAYLIVYYMRNIDELSETISTEGRPF